MAIAAYATIDPIRIRNIISAVLLRTARPEDYAAADSTNTDPLRNVPEIDDAIKETDGIIAGIIRSTPTHRLRRLFFEQIAVTDGQEITFLAIGGVLIDGKNGVEKLPDVIARYKRNRLQLTTNTGYYCWNGQNKSIFNFTGTTAIIDGIQDIGPLFPATPKEYGSGVYWGAMAKVTPKEGKFMELATLASNNWAKVIEVIRLGQEGDKLPRPPQLEIAGFGGS